MLLLSELTRSYKGLVCLYLALVIFNYGFAQEQPVAQEEKMDPVIAAYHLAEIDVNKIRWFGEGCIMGGLYVGYLLITAMARTYTAGSFFPDSPRGKIKPPPAAVLAGKSPEYVEIFTIAYKAKAKSIQYNWYRYGCITGMTGCFLIMLLSIILGS